MHNLNFLLYLIRLDVIALATSAFQISVVILPQHPFFQLVDLSKYPPRHRSIITQTSAFTSSIHPPNIRIHIVNPSPPKHLLFMSLIHLQTFAFTPIPKHPHSRCQSQTSAFLNPLQSIPQTFAFHVVNPSPIPAPRSDKETTALLSRMDVEIPMSELSKTTTVN